MDYVTSHSSDPEDRGQEAVCSLVRPVGMSVCCEPFGQKDVFLVLHSVNMVSKLCRCLDDLIYCS